MRQTDAIDRRQLLRKLQKDALASFAAVHQGLAAVRGDQQEGGRRIDGLDRQDPHETRHFWIWMVDLCVCVCVCCGTAGLDLFLAWDKMDGSNVDGILQFLVVVNSREQLGEKFVHH
jgi:hypothetical protein